MITDDPNQLTAEEQAVFDAQRDEAEQAPDTQVEQPVLDQRSDPPDGDGADPPPAEEPERPVSEQYKAALVEERERRKEIERSVAEREKQWEQRYNMLLQRFAPPQEPQPNQPATLPDRETNPVAYLEALALEAKQGVAAVQQALNQRGQQDQQAQLIATIRQHTAAEAARFRQTTPDFNDAYQYLVNSRHVELELAGWTNPADRQTTIDQEELGLAARALQDRRNPAEVVYALAKQRGYTAPQPNPSGPAPEERLQAVARSQQQARSSLSSARGTGPSTVTGETIARMTEAQFNTWYDKASAAQKRAVLGG